MTAEGYIVITGAIPIQFASCNPHLAIRHASTIQLSTFNRPIVHRQPSIVFRHSIFNPQPLQRTVHGPLSPVHRP
ncbi:MAG TPA: hypothetical protein VIK64_04740, partial [Anaerolineales bacterium]